MSETVDTIISKAETLSPDEKAELIDRLLVAFHKTNSEIDAYWGEEAERRLDAYDRGEMTAIDISEITYESLTK